MQTRSHPKTTPSSPAAKPQPPSRSSASPTSTPSTTATASPMPPRQLLSPGADVVVEIPRRNPTAGDGTSSRSRPSRQPPLRIPRSNLDPSTFGTTIRNGPPLHLSKHLPSFSTHPRHRLRSRFPPGAGTGAATSITSTTSPLRSPRHHQQSVSVAWTRERKLTAEDRESEKTADGNQHPTPPRPPRLRGEKRTKT